MVTLRWINDAYKIIGLSDYYGNPGKSTNFQAMKDVFLDIAKDLHLSTKEATDDLGRPMMTAEKIDLI